MSRYLILLGTQLAIRDDVRSLLERLVKDGGIADLRELWLGSQEDYSVINGEPDSFRDDNARRILEGISRNGEGLWAFDVKARDRVEIGRLLTVLGDRYAEEPVMQGEYKSESVTKGRQMSFF